MPSSFTHAIAGIALASPAAPQLVPRRYWILAAVAATVVDADYLWRYGSLPYGHWLAHRGLTHTPAFAAVLAGLMVWLGFRGDAWRGQRRQLWLGLTLATASHGVLDAMSTYAAGVPFLFPFSTDRYVMLWQPLTSVRHAWATSRTLMVVSVMLRELLWVWLPALALLGIVRVLQGLNAPARPQRG